MTKTKSNVMSDFVAPIGVLTAICLVMTLLLAVTNYITAPIIAATQARIEEEARLEVLPAADSFEKVEFAVPDGSPVTGIYKANNGAGYVFMLAAEGYGGKGTLVMSVGIDGDGKIVDTKVISHKATPGMGSKVTGDDFKGQFPGKTDEDLANGAIDTISGATKSSNFYINAVRDAFAVYDLVKEG